MLMLVVLCFVASALAVPTPDVPAVRDARSETRQQCIARCQKLPQYSYQATVCVANCPGSRKLDNAMEVGAEVYKVPAVREARETPKECANKCGYYALSWYAQLQCIKRCHDARMINDVTEAAFEKTDKEFYEVTTARQARFDSEACFKKCMALNNNDRFYYIGCRYHCNQ